MNKLLRLFCALAVVIYACACTELDLAGMDKTAKLNTALVVPLGYTKATILDVVNRVDDPMLVADPKNNTCYLHLMDTLKLPVDTTIADFSYGTEYDASIRTVPAVVVLIPPSGSATINAAGAALINQANVLNQNHDYDFDFNDYEGGTQVQRIDSMDVNSATVNMTVDMSGFSGISATGAYIEMVVTFPNIAELAGVSHSIALKQNQTTASFEITNFRMTFSGNQTLELMRVKYLLHVPGANTITVQSTADIQTHILVNQIDCFRAWGFFNRSNPVTQDSIYTEIPTDFFESSAFTQNRLLFHDPIVTFDIVTNIGIPLLFTVDDIKAVGANGEEVYGDFNGSTSYSIPMAKPVEGSTRTSTAIFNRTNGRTNLLFTITPKHFVYNFHVTVDHAAVVSDPHHFLYRPAFVDMYIDAKMPFKFDPTSTYAYRDTVDADIHAALNFNSGEVDINKLTVNIQFENSLPAQALAEATFLDANGNVLFTQRDIAIDAPSVDANGFSTETTTSKVKIVVADESQILDTKKILINFQVLGRSQSDLLNFRLSDALKANISLFLNGSYTTDLDSIF